MADRPKRPLSLRILALIIGVIALLGALPVLCSKFGYQFLPSVQWVNQTEPVATILGAIAAVAAPVFFLKQIPAPPSKLDIAMKYPCACLAPFLGFMVFSHFVSLGIPIAAAMAAGVESEAEYTVSRAKLETAGKCRNPVTIKNMPALWGKICNAPEEFVQGLRPGSEITVTGSWTQLGLFVSRVSQRD